MRRLVAALLTAAVLLPPAAAVYGREFPPPVPFDRIALSQLGYANTTLRGPLVSSDYFIPGPADFLLADDPKTPTQVDLDFIPSELLAKESVMVVLWNGVPLHDRQIGGGSGRPERVTLAVPTGRVDPEVNVLSVQAQLRLAIDTCEAGSVDSPARHLTVMATSAVRYALAEPKIGQAAVVRPDLARYPLPFFSATHPQPAPVRFVVPDHPTTAELSALARVAAQLGQYAGDRGVKVELARASDVRESDLARTHTILVGKRAALPLLLRLTNAPLGQDRDGRFMDERGRALGDDVGVVELMAAPWSPSRGVLVVSGGTDVAVSKAAVALAGREGIQALRGAYAIVPDAAPYTATSAITRATTLADLGRKDEQVNGIGDHAISLILFLSAVPKDSSVPFDLIVSHSGLLDLSRSSLRVVVNDLPLESLAYRDLAPVHAVRRIDLPDAALKPGANVIRVEFSHRLPGLIDRDSCNAIPVEQAWSVLHSDSAIGAPTAAARRTTDPDLATYPYPFQRQGRLDETLLVTPTDLGANPQAVIQFMSEIGRGTNAGLQRPTVVSATDFDPARDAKDRDVILFGLPGDNHVMRDLGARLPVEVGSDQRLLLAPELTIRVSDLQRLGVVEEIASPWSPDRAVMVVTGTSDEGLDLAVEAARQRNMAGSVTLASRQQPRPLAAGATATPPPLAYGGPAPIPLDVSSYRLRPAILAPQQQLKIPWALLAAAVAGLLVVIFALAEGYQAFRGGERR